MLRWPLRPVGLLLSELDCSSYSQESDYMGVVFHFYDSEDEDDEDDEEPTPRFNMPRMGVSPLKPHSRAGQPSKLAELK